MEENRVYIKDFKNTRPVHYDCVVSDVLLPWSKEEIQIYTDCVQIDRYYPVLPKGQRRPDGIYLDDGVYERGYFTKEEYDDYCERCRKRAQEQDEEREDAYNKMSYVWENLQRDYKDIAKECAYTQRYIENGLYEMRCFMGKITVVRFKDSQLARRYHWNIDKTFKTVEIELEEAHKKFVEIITED